MVLYHFLYPCLLYAVSSVPSPSKVKGGWAGKDANSSADLTLADSQSLLSLCPPPVYLFLTQSSVRKFYYSTVNAYSGVNSSLTFLSEITPEFRNNNAFGQFDGFNKQRFILLTSVLNKPAHVIFVKRKMDLDYDDAIYTALGYVCQNTEVLQIEPHNDSGRTHVLSQTSCAHPFLAPAIQFMSPTCFLEANIPNNTKLSSHIPLYFFG